eukprot:evm.model.NODE_48856_length_45577_cov_40.689011.4
MTGGGKGATQWEGDDPGNEKERMLAAKEEREKDGEGVEVEEEEEKEEEKEAEEEASSGGIGCSMEVVEWEEVTSSRCLLSLRCWP